MTSMTPERRQLAVTAIATTIVMAVCFAVLELLVRTFIFDPSLSYIRTPGWSMLVKTNGKLPHVEGDHRIVVNSQGFRGDLPPLNPSPSIAVIGGSTIEDWVLSEEETSTKQLQRNLQTCLPDAWAANLGKSGTNARHHLIQLPETESYMPHYDYIVVLMGLNDFLFDFRIHHPIDLPDNWWRDQALMSQGGSEGSLATVALLKRILSALTNSAGQAQVSDFGAYMEFLWDSYRAVQDDQWVDTLPDTTEHLATYQNTIRSLKRYADKYGTKIVFVTQPYVWSDNMDDATLNQIYAGFIGSDISSPDTKWYTTNALEQGLSAYNATLLETCRKDGLICVDAAGMIPREARYFYDDFHLSEQGAAKLGEIVADSLKALDPSCQQPYRFPNGHSAR